MGSSVLSTPCISIFDTMEGRFLTHEFCAGGPRSRLRVFAAESKLPVVQILFSMSSKTHLFNIKKHKKFMFSSTDMPGYIMNHGPKSRCDEKPSEPQNTKDSSLLTGFGLICRFTANLACMYDSKTVHKVTDGGENNGIHNCGRPQDLFLVGRGMRHPSANAL